MEVDLELHRIDRKKGDGKGLEKAEERLENTRVHSLSHHRNSLSY